MFGSAAQTLLDRDWSSSTIGHIVLAERAGAGKEALSSFAMRFSLWVLRAHWFNALSSNIVISVTQHAETLDVSHLLRPFSRSIALVVLECVHCVRREYRTSCLTG